MLSKEEIEFNTWLNSIEFVNADGEVIEAVLTEDESEDPEEDRSE